MVDPMENSPEQHLKVYRVAEITRLIKSILEDEVGEVWIEGELSNVKRPSSGHYYFTIKDENAQIAAVMFRGRQTGLRFQPEDGLAVKILGLVSVYEKSGQYQVIVYRMEPAGKGALLAALEALKKKLELEGLFDPARKKPLPVLPQHIGIVTSPTGAAIRDILKVILRRFPNLHIVIAPVRVQGQGASAEIAAAIDEFNAMGGLDVLIVGRGGGSLEDLWCFNEESVARAIARSGIPVVSAVGHEVDFTISDFVADLRAPTPSAAAELVVGLKLDFEREFAAYTQQMLRALRQYALGIRNRYIAASGSYVFREPRNLARRYLERLCRLQNQVQHSGQTLFREYQQRVDESNFRMLKQTEAWQRVSEMNLRRLESVLRGINPLAVLGRGYSITMRADGSIIKSAGQVKCGVRIFTRLADGKLESEVVGKDES